MIHVHILAGLLAIVCGAAALLAPKGGLLHRKSGTVFVCAMLVMSSTGFTVAVFREQGINMVAASLVFYLVSTGWLTLQPASPLVRRAGFAAMAVGALVALGAFASGAAAAGQGRSSLAAFLIVFGSIAALGAVGDWRMLSRGVAGPRRLARHIWRMSTAMLIATMAFFLGQAKVFPEAMQRPLLLALPVLAVLVAMLYWLGKVSMANKRVQA